MDLLSQLNDVQRAAVSALDGPVMVVAGAGSGKTRVLTYRVANLILHNIKPYEILALTFTNKAAREMKERIERLVGPAAAQVWAGTFHSIFARILRHESEHIGYDRNFTIYDTEDSRAAVKRIMENHNISAQRFSPRAIHARISSAKNHLVTPEQYAHLAKEPAEEATALVYQDYVRTLKSNNAMDFDDLLLKPIELFQHHPNVLEKYHYRFRYLLVDEYQDTNRAQYMMIRLLAQKFKNVCVVGDDAQSIYSFRGADINNILDFEKDYPGCKIYRLEQNYRSTKTILAAADNVIKNNKGQIRKTLWTANPQGDHVTMIEAEDDKDEGMRIVNHLRRECTQRKLDLKDVAILYRTNSQSRSLEDALRRSAIPYVIIGGVEFYKRKEVKDVLSYLRVVVNPRDEESLLRVINYPVRGIGDTSIARIAAFAKSMPAEQRSLFGALCNVQQITALNDRAKNAVIHFVAFIMKYRNLRGELSAAELTHALVGELEMLKKFKDEATPESLARWENVQELLSALTEYCADNPEGSLESFLEEVSLLSDADQKTDGNAVTLMTLHGAKGLEFPLVFITGAEDGLLPLYQSSPDPAEVEEERRLFYVGITRAMQKLYITHTRARYRNGELTFPVISRFVLEIEEQLIQKEGPVLHHHPAAGGINRQQNSSKRRETQPASRPHADPLPDYENESQEPQSLHVGAFVVHESFGRGKVIQLAGRGDSAKAVVLFDGVGRKNLMLKFANLRGA